MRRRWAALAAMALVSCGAGDGLPGHPEGLPALLDHIPAAVVERGLYFGMGSALPIDGTLGFTRADIELTLESGVPPFTVLVGDFDRAALADAAPRHGYEAEEAHGWEVYERRDAGDSTTLAASVPALAVRGRMLVLGTGAEVRDAVQRPGAPEWLLRLSRALGPATGQAVLSPPVDLARHARRLGADEATLLERHGAHAPLPHYLGYAIGGSGDGEGVIVLAFPVGTERADQAGALAERLATTSILGEPGRRLADDLHAAGPRWLDEPSVVRLPVTWRAFDAARLRSDAEAQRLVFLAPSPN